MSRARCGHGCATLGNLVYAVGGSSVQLGLRRGRAACMETLQGVEAYDAATGCWAPCAQLRVPRSGARLAALDDRHLAAIGGSNDGVGPYSEMLTSVEIFDSQVGHWALLGRTLSVGRSTAGVAAIGGEEVLVIGGWPGLASAEVYRVPLEEKKEEATTSASAAAAAPQAGNGAYSKDGHPDAGHGQPGQERMPIQQLTDGRWDCQAVTMMLPAPGHDFPLCTRKCVVVVGGVTECAIWGGRACSSVLLYDVETDTWWVNHAFPPHSDASNRHGSVRSPRQGVRPSRMRRNGVRALQNHPHHLP